MTSINILDPNSLQAYRYRVKLLSTELWQEKDQRRRMNLSLQLAEAATHLARMETEEFQSLQTAKIELRES
ncbi:hypothetical protein HC931_18545 [Candidatus Gracilibacteria bacterium]|nr:hypothetical protein [Candidatus Gracilibacteria bacterium]NJM86269.1 hypothetical protein [Hydrococcus sp. RU_2_2]NJP18085.1 hypothetical protein [Hydrococcus sp. CRU_1_1]